jgi:hypothetical protein
MPLYLRNARDHYPDRHERDGDKYFVLCGNLIAGSVEAIASGPSAGEWTWGTSLGGGLTAGGRANSLEAGRRILADAFRVLVARADLAERPDAKAGPPVHDPPPPSADELPAWTPPQHDPNWDRDDPVVIHQPKRFAVYSGELLVGVLEEVARVPNAGHWTWGLSGTRPSPPYFVWRGHAQTLDEARAAHTACWAGWLRWAGLEQKQPTRWRLS